MKVSEYTFVSCDTKTPIHVRRWEPDTPPARIVQLAHGIAEHAGRYGGFAEFLASNGCLVVANDHLGCGKSVSAEGKLGFFAENGGWELAVGDMRRLYELTSAEYPDLPYFLLGHSMGSFLARTYIIRYRDGLSGVILSGTGQLLPPVIAAGKALGRFEAGRHGKRFCSPKLNDLAFGKYNDGFAPVRTVFDWISRDESVVDGYLADPLSGWIPTVGMFCDMLGGIEFIGKRRNMERMNKSLRVLFVSGDRDPVGENGKGVMRVYSAFLACGMEDVALKLYSGGRHEMLNEINRSEVYADILDWLEAGASHASKEM